MNLPVVSKELIKIAVLEDTINGDITTESVFKKDKSAAFKILSKDNGIFCGQIVVNEIIKEYTALEILWFVNDGDTINKGSEIAKLSGSLKELLTYERIILNFLEKISGIASLSNTMSKKIKGTGVKLVDTRKTTPGWRWIEKYAVRTGGSYNHRFNLSDGILIKDNHKFAAGSIGKAIEAAKANTPHTLKIEAEVDNFKELEEALEAGADIVLLDNFSVEETRKAVNFINKRILLESSGNITLDTVLDYAKTGVDYISSGFLTYGATWLDMSAEYSDF